MQPSKFGLQKTIKLTTIYLVCYYKDVNRKIIIVVVGVISIIAAGFLVIQSNSLSPSPQTSEEALKQAREYSTDKSCTLAVVPAKHTATGAKYTFPSGCLPEGWAPYDGKLQISGRITTLNKSCYSDGTCSITVDGNKSIVTSCPNGFTADRRACNSVDLDKLEVGDTVTANVQETDESNSYDIQCEGCTVSKTN